MTYKKKSKLKYVSYKNLINLDNNCQTNLKYNILKTYNNKRNIFEIEV